jgi:hypothetical protein
MKKFISLNAKSVLMYTFMITMAFVIETLAIIDRNPMMYIIPIVLVWMIFAGFMALFSRCKFIKDELIVFGDFLVQENSRIQKKHNIKFNDVEDYRHEILPSDVDSYFNPIKLSYKARQQYLSLYGYSTIECITFYLKDGKKECLITNRYSKKQITEINLLLKQKISSSSFDIDYNSINSDKKEKVSIQRFKYPKYIVLFMILYIVTFGIFAIHSWNLGGDAINGYVNGNEHFVSSHGTDTLVTYQEWILNYYLGIAMFISAALLFPSVFIYHIKNWLSMRNRNN